MRSVKEKYAELCTKMLQISNEIDALRSECEHTFAEKKHRSNTGNYDPTADCYWTEFRCGDCGKFWIEDGSV